MQFFGKIKIPEDENAINKWFWKICTYNANKHNFKNSLTNSAYLSYSKDGKFFRKITYRNKYLTPIPNLWGWPLLCFVVVFKGYTKITTQSSVKIRTAYYILLRNVHVPTSIIVLASSNPNFCWHQTGCIKFLQTS